MNELLKAVLQAIKYPVWYDADGQMIFDQDGKMLLDVRGWGWIQHLDKDSSKAGKMQDAFGNEICRLINENQPEV